MKKLVLSLFVTLSFTGYAVYQRLIGFSWTVGNVRSAPLANNSTDNAGAISVPPPQPPVTSSQPVRSIPRGGFGEDDFEDDDGGYFIRTTPVPLSGTVAPVATTPAPAPVPTTPVAKTGLYRDGSYTGNVADAYYGNVQVKVIISGGKISDVQFLDHPQDRSTSVRINNYAMPILTSQAISIQNANVDGVSGATATSGAFVQSLSSALAVAKN